MTETLLVVRYPNGVEIKVPLVEGATVEYVPKVPRFTKAPREDRSFVYCGPEWN